METALVVNIWKHFKKSWGGIDILHRNILILISQFKTFEYLATIVHSAL